MKFLYSPRHSYRYLQVEKACLTSSIHLVAARRKVCAQLLEDHFDTIAAAFRAIADAHVNGDASDEPDAVTAVCGNSTRICEGKYADMEVSDVVKLEEQLALSSVSGAGNGAGEEDDEKRQFLSESKPGKKAQRTFGSARKLVASTFLDEVVVAEQRDAVVYFATPKATPRLHAATLANVHWLAEQTSSKGCLVGVLDVELNHVPPPYGTHLAAGASVQIYAAGRKRSPVVAFHHDVAHGDVGADVAPRRSDLLSILGRRAGRVDTQARANASAIRLTDAVRDGSAREL